VKDAMAKVLEDPVDGVNVKLDKVLELLKENFLAVEMQLRPAELLVHPGNRGGSMVSPHDVHRKGQNVVNTGLKRSLLAASSLCVELPRLPHVRKESDLVQPSRRLAWWSARPRGILDIRLQPLGAILQGHGARCNGAQW